MAAGLEAGLAVDAGTPAVAADEAFGAADGITPVVGAALAAGAALSRTLPPVLARTVLPLLPRYVNVKVQTKNSVAHAAVERDRKLALPVAPNRLPEAPLPNDAPMSAPLPCWISTRPIIVSAESSCTARIRVIHICMMVGTPGNG